MKTITKNLLILVAMITAATIVGCPQKSEPKALARYTVTFDKNHPEAKGSMAPQIYEVGLEQKLTPNIFDLTYHEFKGWALTPNGDKKYIDQQSITVSSNMTLYAVWEEKICTITFNKNADDAVGTMYIQAIEKSLPGVLSENKFTRPNCEFLGWATSPDGEKVYDDKGEITVKRSTELYAVWELNKYTVTFNANGGSGTMEAQVFTHGVAQNLVAKGFTHESLPFLGWAKTPNGKKEYDDEESISITSNMTLYAVWKVGLVSISVSPIYTGDYFVGDTITTEDITVTATYNDDTSKAVTDWTTDETFTSVATNKEIKIFYTKDEITKTAPLTITIVNEYTITYTVTDTATTLTGHDGTAGLEKTYVQFGDWPQTIKANGVRVLERQKKETGLFTYYAGSDGNWYVKQAENAYWSGDNYKYSDGSQAAKKSAGTSKYFKVEPIKWRVLEEKDGKKFLLAEDGLIAVPYYDFLSGYRLIDSETIYPSNYKHSKIRAFLNGYTYQGFNKDNKYYFNCTDYQDKGFLHTAFTTEAQSKVVTTTVDNSVESTPLIDGNRYVCEDTDDKVFVLSLKEALTETYGFSTDQYNSCGTRIRKPTDFALATGTHNIAGFGGYWSLRSPHASEGVFGITHQGKIWGYPVGDSEDSAIVPALWVME
ncbi:MAG: InlB B-repeat-containing protein [Spirochaetaceae bacterium]|nr:InlB B-repeat-containing protein [Spirochaetaceae bacterium]